MAVIQSGLTFKEDLYWLDNSSIDRIYALADLFPGRYPVVRVGGWGGTDDAKMKEIQRSSVGFCIASGPRFLPENVFTGNQPKQYTDIYFKSEPYHFFREVIDSLDVYLTLGIPLARYREVSAVSGGAGIDLQLKLPINDANRYLRPIRTVIGKKQE